MGSSWAGHTLYLTAFLVSTIVTGNLGHTLATYDVMEEPMCLGSSGGICGLYGLMYVSLLKMGNNRATSIIKELGLHFCCMAVFENISNAACWWLFLGARTRWVFCVVRNTERLSDTSGVCGIG
jgi:hypothetical protein